jgi:hypothetical protein
MPPRVRRFQRDATEIHQPHPFRVFGRPLRCLANQATMHFQLQRLLSETRITRNRSWCRAKHVALAVSKRLIVAPYLVGRALRILGRSWIPRDRTAAAAPPECPRAFRVGYGAPLSSFSCCRALPGGSGFAAPLLQLPRVRGHSRERVAPRAEAKVQPALRRRTDVVPRPVQDRPAPTMGDALGHPTATNRCGTFPASASPLRLRPRSTGTRAFRRGPLISSLGFFRPLRAVG